MPTSYIVPQLFIELFFESLFTNFFLLYDFEVFFAFLGTNFLLNFETHFLLNDHLIHSCLLLKSRLYLIPFCVYCLRLKVWKMASLFDKIFSVVTSAPKQGYEILSWMETTNFFAQLSVSVLAKAQVSFNNYVDKKKVGTRTTDLQWSLFSSKSPTFGLGQTVRADKFLGILGILGWFISTNFELWSPWSMFSINQPLFLSLYIQIQNIHLGLGFEFGPQRIRNLTILCP